MTNRYHKWFERITGIILMLVCPPIGLTALVLPSLSQIEASLSSNFPSIVLFTYIVIWFVDYAGIIYFLNKWAKESSV